MSKIINKSKFMSTLMRDNKTIRDDRAIEIFEKAELIYSRKIQDLEIERKQLVRDRDGMLDLSPTTADSLTLASDFSANDFTIKDIELGMKIRNLDITLEVAQKRYDELFTEIEVG